MEVNMEYNSESYFNSLKRFFQGLRNFYSETQKSYKKKLRNFFQPLIFKYRVIKEIKRQTDRYLASDFNLIEIMGPDENKLSDIIALLIDPNGPHGQGEVFLEKFLEEIKKQTENTRLQDINALLSCKISISRESFTTKIENQDRRIDLTVEFKNPQNNNNPFFIIGIENKPWAGEQENQLEDYKEHLDKISGNDYLLIYLPGLRKEAESIKPETKEKLKQKGKFLETTYCKLLIPWIKECIKECEADKIRWFLKDFVNWIENNFKEEVEDDEGKERNN